MNFTQFLLVLNARKWLILGVLAVTVAVTVVVSLLLPKQYTATTTLIIDSKSKDPFTGQLLPSQMFPGYMATQTDVLTSTQVALKVVKDLKLTTSPGVQEQFQDATEGKGTVEQWLAGVLLKQLEVEPSRESSVIGVSFSGVDPGFSAAIANAFAKAYIETSLELRLTPARQTAEWFDQQIVQLRTKVDEAQQRLTAYQRENGIVESDERLDVETRRLSELAAQMISAQSLSYDASSRTGQSANLPEVNNSPVVQNLKVQIAQGEGQLAELAKRVGANHPEYQRMQAEVASYKSKLAIELSTAKRGVGATAGAALQRVRDLTAAFDRQKAKVLALKQQREEATLLARDLENAQRVYDSALQRYGQSRMEAQSTQTDIAVLNPAVAPLEPSSPNLLLNIILAVFLGSLLGVGVGFLVELLDRRVRSGQDIAMALEIPVLAEVGSSGRFPGFLRRLFRRNRAALA
ncbi:MAG: chain length determinant protein EpsF [Hydrogenophilales bacterium 16-64-46]|nr:MAG: chain length determinant protein EpsF [Hydrogenophilales bacterium 12-64-13]OYZ04381.1 MAG: chain length determinant protein EpsF [Hydrogenophilales bacterium 16-64-46]OZA38254.1 MAG: chain length determinant protein EpsF [Hydrogenophilales bacterium 17-64-34]HQS99158.1 chain length determinant protein EpsF [Thiobacillus sp.]